MTRTVDVIVVGSGRDAIAAALEKARRQMRVMVVMRTRRSDRARGIRRAIREAHDQIDLVTGAEVACIAGVNAIEAVVIRDLRTGRLTGVNASEVLRFEGR